MKIPIACALTVLLTGCAAGSVRLLPEGSPLGIGVARDGRGNVFKLTL